MMDQGMPEPMLRRSSTMEDERRVEEARSTRQSPHFEFPPVSTRPLANLPQSPDPPLIPLLFHRRCDFSPAPQQNQFLPPLPPHPLLSPPTQPRYTPRSYAPVPVWLTRQFHQFRVRFSISPPFLEGRNGFMATRELFSKYADNDGDLIGVLELWREGMGEEVTLYVAFTSTLTRNKAVKSIQKCREWTGRYGMTIAYDYSKEWLWKDVVDEFQDANFLEVTLNAGARATIKVKQSYSADQHRWVPPIPPPVSSLVQLSFLANLSPAHSHSLRRPLPIAESTAQDQFAFRPPPRATATPEPRPVEEEIPSTPKSVPLRPPAITDLPALNISMYATPPPATPSQNPRPVEEEIPPPSPESIPLRLPVLPYDLESPTPARSKQQTSPSGLSITKPTSALFLPTSHREIRVETTQGAKRFSKEIIREDCTILRAVGTGGGKSGRFKTSPSSSLEPGELPEDVGL